MGFIKKAFAFFVLISDTVFAYSAQPKSVEPIQFALLVDKDLTCKQHLEQKIKTMLDITKVKLSDSAFSKDSHLFLTNQKHTSLSDNPMQGYEGGNKIFLLYIKDGDCFISLVDSKDKPLNSLKIDSCECVKAVKK